MDYTRKLAEFCAGVEYDRLPPEVVEKAKLCIFDFFANIKGAHKLEAVKGVAGYVRALGGAEESSALGCGFRTGMHNAAFLNGTAAEAIEAQDGLRFGGNHPGVAVIPAALAAAERLGLGGRAVIEAVVAGYEAADRPAAAMHPHHTMAGFLPTGTCGALGAAAAASRLLGHGAEKMMSSISNAGFMAPISMAEHLMGGFTIKIVQGGQGASAGLTAAWLSEAGLAGTPFVLEGSALKGGFTQITTKSAPVMDRITEGLGEKFSLTDIYLKPFTSCRHTHGAAQAAIELREMEKMSPESIESVRVLTYAIAAFAVGKTIGADDTFVSAQFSLPYVTAACLVDGAMGPEQLGAGRIVDPVIREMMGKVQVGTDNDLCAAYPEKTGTRVEVKLKDGRTVSAQVDVPKGDPRAPMGRDELIDKYARFAGAGCVNAQEVYEKTMSLESVEDIRELTSQI